MDRRERPNASAAVQARMRPPEGARNKNSQHAVADAHDSNSTTPWEEWQVDTPVGLSIAGTFTQGRLDMPAWLKELGTALGPVAPLSVASALPADQAHPTQEIQDSSGGLPDITIKAWVGELVGPTGAPLQQPDFPSQPITTGVALSTMEQIAAMADLVAQQQALQKPANKRDSGRHHSRPSDSDTSQWSNLPTAAGSQPLLIHHTVQELPAATATRGRGGAAAAARANASSALLSLSAPVLQSALVTDRSMEALLQPLEPLMQPDMMAGRSCHCKKSQCLKLYCDCFSAGVYCAGCLCLDCYNRPEHQSKVFEKRVAIMQRDPQAFTRKIQSEGVVGHKKGCNCKRSHCLKKYCECFQGGVLCSLTCKCLECYNMEAGPNLPPEAEAPDEREHIRSRPVAKARLVETTFSSPSEAAPGRNPAASSAAATAAAGLAQGAAGVGTLPEASKSDLLGLQGQQSVAQLLASLADSNISGNMDPASLAALLGSMGPGFPPLALDMQGLQSMQSLQSMQRQQIMQPALSLPALSPASVAAAAASAASLPAAAPGQGSAPSQGPGKGKSTFAARHPHGNKALSADAVAPGILGGHLLYPPPPPLGMPGSAEGAWSRMQEPPSTLPYSSQGTASDFLGLGIGSVRAHPALDAHARTLQLLAGIEGPQSGRASHLSSTNPSGRLPPQCGSLLEAVQHSERLSSQDQHSTPSDSKPPLLAPRPVQYTDADPANPKSAIPELSVSGLGAAVPIKQELATGHTTLPHGSERRLLNQHPGTFSGPEVQQQQVPEHMDTGVEETPGHHLLHLQGPSPAGLGYGLGLGTYGASDLSVLGSPGSLGLAAMLASRTPRLGGEDDPNALGWQVLDGLHQGQSPMAHLLQGNSPHLLHLHHQHHQPLLAATAHHPTASSPPVASVAGGISLQDSPLTETACAVQEPQSPQHPRSMCPPPCHTYRMLPVGGTSSCSRMGMAGSLGDDLGLGLSLDAGGGVHALVSPVRTCRRSVLGVKRQAEVVAGSTRMQPGNARVQHPVPSSPGLDTLAQVVLEVLESEAATASRTALESVVEEEEEMQEVEKVAGMLEQTEEIPAADEDITMSASHMQAGLAGLEQFQAGYRAGVAAAALQSAAAAALQAQALAAAVSPRALDYPTAAQEPLLPPLASHSACSLTAATTQHPPSKLQRSSMSNWMPGHGSGQKEQQGPRTGLSGSAEPCMVGGCGGLRTTPPEAGLTCWAATNTNTPDYGPVFAEPGHVLPSSVPIPPLGDLTNWQAMQAQALAYIASRVTSDRRVGGSGTGAAPPGGMLRSSSTPVPSVFTLPRATGGLGGLGDMQGARSTGGLSAAAGASGAVLGEAGGPLAPSRAQEAHSTEQLGPGLWNSSAYAALISAHVGGRADEEPCANPHHHTPVSLESLLMSPLAGAFGDTSLAMFISPQCTPHYQGLGLGGSGLASPLFQSPVHSLWPSGMHSLLNGGLGLHSRHGVGPTSLVGPEQ